MGLDRVRTAITLAGCMLALTATGCDDDDTRPTRLLREQPAAKFVPIEGSVVTQTRTLRAGFLGRRFTLCLPSADRRAFPSDTLVVERVGTVGESLTFLDGARRHVYACDGGVDAAGERAAPWCGLSVGRLFDGRLLDPRLDVLCRARGGEALAYAWVVPIDGAHWIGVDQGTYIELYEVAAGLPVRIASTRGVDRARARATFDITQYDVRGKPLVRARLEAGVAG